MTDERARVAEELRRLREEVRSSATEPATAVLPPPRPVAAVPPPAADLEAALAAPPPRPDNAPVNELWGLPQGRVPGGLRGMASRLLQRLLAPLFDAQRTFNARQVQLDNEILGYIDARLDRTHRHYDEVLGKYGRHIGEIDTRHLILQEELVAHVHDLVKRIDLVLGESERGRLSLESALRDVRTRLARLEERLGR